MLVKKKCRQYSTEYLAFGFIEPPNDKRLPMCLLCFRSFSNEAMKPSRLIEHLNAMHPEKKNKPLEYFKELLNEFLNRNTIQNLFQKNSERFVYGLVVSYKIAELIAKSGKPHDIGETLILPVLREVIETMFHQDPENILKYLHLSARSIQRRIDC
jgi:hypothetical protein